MQCGLSRVRNIGTMRQTVGKSRIRTDMYFMIRHRHRHGSQKKKVGKVGKAGKEQKADWFAQLKEHLQEEVTVINKQGERRTVQRGDLDRCRLQGFFQCDEDGNVVDEYIYASEVADKIRAGQDPYYGFTGADPGENKTDFTGVR